MNVGRRNAEGDLAAHLVQAVGLVTAQVLDLLAATREGKAEGEASDGGLRCPCPHAHDDTLARNGIGEVNELAHLMADVADGRRRRDTVILELQYTTRIEPVGLG
jgi:hypothetical protein